MSHDHNDRRMALVCSKVLAGDPIEVIHAHEMSESDRQHFGDRLCVQFLCKDDSHPHQNATEDEDDYPVIMHWCCFWEQYGEQLNDDIEAIDGPCQYARAGDSWVRLDPGKESN